MPDTDGGCADHRETMRLIAFRKRLNDAEETLSPEERIELEKEVAALEKHLGLS